MSYSNYAPDPGGRPPLRPRDMKGMRRGKVAAIAHAAVAKALRKPADPAPPHLDARWLAQRGKEEEEVRLMGTIDKQRARDGTKATFAIYELASDGNRGPKVDELEGKVEGGNAHADWSWKHEPDGAEIDPASYKDPRFDFDFTVNGHTAAARPLPVVGFLEFTYVDHEGSPVADFPWIANLPNGEVRRGRTDENGFVRLDNLPPGRVDIRLDP